MKTISISDVTLRKGARGEVPLSFREKMEFIKQLDSLRVDVIELSPIEDVKADTLLMHTIAPLIKKSVLSCPAGTTREEAELAWDGIKKAAHPRLHVILPTSTVQMEYTCNKKPAQILEMIREMVAHCAALCGDVEFSAADATRSEMGFLKEALCAAVAAGAKTVTVCDSAGIMLPDEFGAFIASIREEKTLSDAKLCVQCGSELGMAIANVFAALKSGAVGIKTTITETGLPQLSAVVQAMRTRGNSLNLSCNVQITEIHSAMKKMEFLTAEKKEKTLYDNGFIQTAQEEFVFNAQTDIATVNGAVKQLGYDISDDDKAKVYEAFSRVVSQKPVTTKELEAIIASVALQVPPTYRLVSYVVNSGNTISATANIRLEKNGVAVTGLATGDGSIDAALLAIEQIIGCHYELDDFQIQAVTEGREAMGVTFVKLRSGGKLYSGRGISTDIIGASIHAYLSALNKIVYEENAV